MAKLFFITAFLISMSFPGYSQVVELPYQYGSESYLKAEVLLDEGLLREAEIDLIETINEFGSSPSIDKAIIKSAYTDLLNGNNKNAEITLTEFINERKNSPFVPYAAIQRAFNSLEQKNYEKAENYMNEARRLSEREFDERHDPRYAELAHNALYWQGMAFIRQGKYQDAAPVLEACHSKYPDGKYADDALYALGQSAAVNRKYESAVTYFYKIYKDYPYSNSVLSARIHESNSKLILRDASDALVILKMTENAFNHIFKKDSIGLLYEKQKYLPRPKEEILYLRGEAYNQIGNYKQAYLIFSTFLDTFYQSELKNYVRLGAGWAKLNLSEYGPAIDQFDEIIFSTNEDDNSNVKALAQLYRAVALIRNGEKDKARKELSSLSVQPSYPFLDLVLLELGQLYYKEEDYQLASRTLERADREAIDATVSARIHLLLGASFLEQKLWNKASNEYFLAEQLATKSSYIAMPQKDWYLAEARLKRGIALVKSHRSSEAIPTLQSFIGDFNKNRRTPEALFWLAEAYYRTDLFNNAIDIYKTIVTYYYSSPRREEALYGLGWSYFRIRKLRESAETFDKLIKEFPDTQYGTEVLARQADGYYLMKNYSKAAEYYFKAMERSPNSDHGQYCAYQLCFAYYRMNSFEKAINAALNFVRKYPNSTFAPKSMYLVGWIRFQQGKYNEAIDNFKFLIKAYPSSGLVARSHYTIGDAYYNSGNYNSAIDAYKTVVELFPSSDLAPEAMKSMQQCLLILGREDEALALADKIIETNPTSPFAEDFAWGKTDVFYSGGRYKDAISEIENFMKKYPGSQKNPEALYRMEKSYISLNQPENAERTVSKLKSKYSGSEYTPTAVLELALMYKNLGDIEKADSIFAGISVDYPSSPAAAQAGFERATVKYSLGDTSAAIALYRSVADSFPGMEYADQSRWKIAMHLRALGLNDSSRKEFEILAQSQTNPDIAAEAQYRIGELFVRDKMYEQAVQAFKVFIDKFSAYKSWYPLVLLNLGESYENLDKFELARDTYKSLIALRPDDDFGKTAAMRLKRLPKE